MTGTPSAVASRADWRGPALDWRAEGMHVLTGVEIAEIDAALAHLRGLGPVDFPDISAERFPLPRFGAVLRGRSEALRAGHGFLLLRGLPRERYSPDDMALIYFGPGAYLGRPMPQSWQGELLGQVIDIADLQDEVRGYNAGGGQRMHTDSCDIVGLMCLQSAASGGASRICSALAVHNHMAEHHPELLQTLYDGFVCRRAPRDAEHGTGIAVRPISIYERNGDEVTCCISSDYPRRAVAAGDTVLSNRQRAALDMFHALSGSPDFFLDMEIGDGDIQFLNNRVLVHGRTDYRDHPHVGRRRHLLWLRATGWPPPSARQAMHDADDHRLWLRQRQTFMELPSAFQTRMVREWARRSTAPADVAAAEM